MKKSGPWGRLLIELPCEPLRTPRRAAARIALHARAVAHQREVAALLAAVAFVAFDTGGADALEAQFGRVILLRQWRYGERAVELGNLLAVHALETVGPQEYELKPAALADRARAAYGDEAAADLTANLPA